ncbi:MAG: PIG-L family deacetylase [Bacillota bacterium]|nr:PIG-L family deacetylase [Bacillota bacterium]
MNILAIGAHPDDLELMCGGTLAKYAAQGNKVFMVHVSTGNVGHMVIPPDELIQIRGREAQEAGALIGAEVVSLGESDLFVRADNMETRDKVIDLIRYTRPDVIITHSPHDYMDDHEQTSALVYEASMAATVPHHKTQHPFYGRLTPIYYMEAVAGIGPMPEELVDITEFIDIKLEMLGKHVSQHKWLKEHDNMDVIDMARTISKARGYQADVGYAEGFFMCRQYHKLATRRWLP